MNTPAAVDARRRQSALPPSRVPPSASIAAPSGVHSATSARAHPESRCVMLLPACWRRPVATTFCPYAGALQHARESSPAQNNPSNTNVFAAPSPRTTDPLARLQHPRPSEANSPQGFSSESQRRARRGRARAGLRACPPLRAHRTTAAQARSPCKLGAAKARARSHAAPDSATPSLRGRSLRPRPFRGRAVAVRT